MSGADYKYYVCPACRDYYLEPELEKFICFHCGYEHPRDRENELVKGLVWTADDGWAARRQRGRNLWMIGPRLTLWIKRRRHQIRVAVMHHLRGG
jgi:hypothetical protein